MRSTRKNRRYGFERLESRRVLSSLYTVATTGSDTTGDGSAAHPFATIQHAADLTHAGDTVIVKAGQYAGFVLGWDSPQGGTANAPITYQAEPGAVIVSRNVHTADGIDLEPGDSFVNIYGFTVNNINGNITRAGIRVTGSDHVNVVGNTSTGNGTWGIFTAFSNYTLIKNNIGSNSITQHGIYVSNSSDHPTIVGNTLFGNAGAGIHLNGDLSQGGTGQITNALIENNIIHDNGKSGGAGINGDGLCNSVIENNLLYNNHASGIALFQIDGATGALNNVVMNNTIVMASDGRWAININTGSTGNVLFDNVLFNENPGHGDILIDSSSLVGFKSDYNVLAGREDVGNGSSFENLAAWQAQTGQDVHSLVSTEAAVFINPAGSNYRLATNGPALNAGIASFAGSSAPTIDLPGNPRPSGGAFDIGAYETQTVQQNPPTLTLSGAASVNAGDTYTLTLSSSDSVNDGMTSWLVNWGDGNTQTVSAGSETLVNGQWITSTTATHDYTSGGVKTVSATGTDANGTFAAGNTLVVQVNAARPKLTISGASSVDAGKLYTLTLNSSSSFNDGMKTWKVNWGDGKSQIVNAGAETLVNGAWTTTATVTHVYASPGHDTILATGTDLNGTFGAGNSLAIQVNAPRPKLTLSGASSVDAGKPYTLTLSSSDSFNDGMKTWKVNWGDGKTQTVQAGNETFVNGVWVSTVTITHAYATPGHDTILATATDAYGTFGAGNSLAVQVNAARPKLGLTGATTVMAQSTYTLTLSSSDSFNDAMQSWKINWGDGKTQTIQAGSESLVNGLWVTTIRATHLYTSTGPKTISAMATDAYGTYSAGNTLLIQVR